MHFTQVFQEIESLLKMRCPNCRPPCHEIRKLFQDDWLDVYAPYGEEGPRVDLLSSISLVNRYWFSVTIIYKSCNIRNLFSQSIHLCMCMLTCNFISEMIWRL